MFAAIRNTLPRQLTRAYSTAPAGAKNGNGILWASLATGAVLVGGYYYTRSREATEGGAASSSVPATKALDPANFVAFKLKETIPINHDTSRFRFALEPNQELGLDITSCFVVKAKVGNDEKPTIRPYTPVSPQHARGYFDLVIKKYPTGKMSSHAASANWQGDVGYVTKELVQKYMPSAGKDGILVSVCGPVPMMKSISGVKAPDYSQGEVGGIFKELGYTSEQVFKF
ncbi:hypothetical protein EV174_001466 [Coemansia sp. RSA 2320]|nr:hypothetical protein EV174_001466 [Coemansia sp. RSA 2320]